MNQPPPPPFDLEAALLQLAGHKDAEAARRLINMGMGSARDRAYACLCFERKWSRAYAERVLAIVRATDSDDDIPF